MTSTVVGTVLADAILLAIACIFAMLTARAFRQGRISVNRRWVTNSDQPVVFWLIIAGNTTAIGFLIHTAIKVTRESI